MTIAQRTARATIDRRCCDRRRGVARWRSIGSTGLARIAPPFVIAESPAMRSTTVPTTNMWPSPACRSVRFFADNDRWPGECVPGQSKPPIHGGRREQACLALRTPDQPRTRYRDDRIAKAWCSD
jgi:hypothetical protein